MRILFLGDVSHANAISWIDALRNMGHCEVITYSLGDQRSKSFGRIARIFEWVTAVPRIKRLVKKHKPDIMIAYRSTSYGCLGVLSGFHPLVVAMQGASDVWPLNSWSTPLKRMLARSAFKHADLVHAWGSHMARSAVELGADTKKIMVLPRGINTDIFYPSPTAPRLDKIRLIVTRSLFTEYRHTIILQAAADLKRKGRNVEVHIVGQGALLKSLQQEAKDRNIDDITHFHGKMDHTQLPELLRSCNIYVSMPISEGVSASLFEAMGCGCFPVVSDLEANRAWIENGVNGLLIPLDDVAKLSDALAYVQDHPEFYAGVLEKNRELIKEKATVRHNIKRFVTEYERLIREHRKS